jgi:phosphate transport system substrate-binding protein
VKFTPAVLADIFLGKLTKWNDARIASVNPGVTLPNTDIIVVHRSDGSGTSFVFTDYLTKASPEWAKQVGKATSVQWPIGLGGKGNEGVTQQVKQSEGSIGYVELIYALSNRLPFASVKNSSGQFVTPDLKSVTAAAASAEFAPDTDYRVSITNAPGAEAYPIASFTWLLVKPTPTDSAKGRQINDFLKWMLEPEAQRIAADLNYAPLPVPLIQMLQKRVGG